MSDRLIIYDRPLTRLEKEVRRTGLDHYFIIDWLSLNAVEEYCEEGDFEGARDELENNILTLETFRNYLSKTIRLLENTTYIDEWEEEVEGNE